MTATEALENTRELARLADRLGFTRYWLAEHHNMPGLASSSPEILIGQIARDTTHLRVGSGGVMLPNHAPLRVAESFQTLEALFPGRIDLGIGRAAGTDPRTALALRRSREAFGAEDLPEQLADLFAFGGAGFPEGHPFRSVAAVPAGVSLPPVWLLGSSDYSARLAGQLGLRFAFAHHINPYGAQEALALYRQHFVPSPVLPQPQGLVTASVICADTDADADALALSLDLSWLRLHAGRPSPIPTVEEARAHPYTVAERAQVQVNRERLLWGSPDSVRAKLCTLAGHAGVDEVMVTTLVHNHAARLHSYELLAQAFLPSSSHPVLI